MEHFRWGGGGKKMSHFYARIALEVLKYIRFSTLYFCFVIPSRYCVVLYITT